MNFKLDNVVKILGKELEGWYVAAIQGLPDFVLAVLALISFVFAAKIARRVSRRLFTQLSWQKPLPGLLASILYASLVAVGLFISLGILNLDKTLTSLLAGAGVVGLAIGFAFQEIASNFVSGILIAIKKPYRIDDIVQIGEYFGKVESINIRTTSIRTFDGLEAIVPNKRMFTEALINFTSTPTRRVDVSAGISYDDDLEEAASLAVDAVESLNLHTKDSEIELYYKEFGDSSINFDLRFWIQYPDKKAYLVSRHKAIIAIKKAFDRNGITIPFPIRTLDINAKNTELRGNLAATTSSEEQSEFAKTGTEN